jgi:hypothetical protein
VPSGVVWACCVTRHDFLQAFHESMKALFSYTFLAGLFAYSLSAFVYTTIAILSNVNLLSTPLSLLSFAATNPNPNAVYSALSPTEPSFVSRAFSDSMQPSNIVPFYYKAASKRDDNDITITTLVTGNRFQVFSRLVSTYQGD